MPRRRSYVTPVDEKTIGERLHELRLRRGMSQVEIAEKVGINQTLVSQYERGKLRLHGALVAALARALRVSADQILGLSRLRAENTLKDRRLFQRLQRLDELPNNEKKTILRTLDLLLKKAG